MNPTRKQQIFLLLFFLLVVFLQQIVVHAKIFLIIADQFLNIHKPLEVLTPAPHQKVVTFDFEGRRVVADLYTPNQEYSFFKEKKPALIISLAVRIGEEDRKNIYGFAKALSRFGYVVLWPRSEAVEKKVSPSEDPQLFIDSFSYLEKQNLVDNKRISYMGISAGASLAFIAASDEKIRQKVRGFVFFGGYYNIIDYIIDVVTKTTQTDAKIQQWLPHEDATFHTKSILKEKRIAEIFNLKTREEAYLFIENLPEEKSLELQKLNPKNFAKNFKARIFLIHDKNDSHVPYLESVKLFNALPKMVHKSILIVDIFDHTTPKAGFSSRQAGELWKIYWLFYDALKNL